MKKSTVVLFFLLLTFNVSAQVTFQKNYGFGNEIGYKVLPTTGGYLLVGSLNFGNSSDALVTKTDFDGNVIWSRSYGGINSDDVFSIDSTYDGGFILAGYTNSFGGLDPNDFDYILLFKIDSSGNLLWSRIIEVDEVDVAYSVCETFDHGFALTGMASLDLFLLKTDSLGAVEWTTLYGASNNSWEAGRTVVQTRDSGYAVLGMSHQSGSPDSLAMLLVLNNSGTLIYSNYYKVTNTNVNDDITYAYDLIQNSNGDLVIAGGCGGFFQGLFYAYSPYLIKTDSIGNFIIAKTYAFNTGDCKAYSIREIAGGNYIMGGTMGNFYPFMLKANSQLNKTWCYYYGNYSTPQLFNAGYGLCAEPANDGGFILTGYRTYSNPGIFSTLIKTNSSGQSGCNQDIPDFGGNASIATHTTVSGSVLLTSSPNNYASVTLTETVISLPDSVMCGPTSIDEIASDFFQVYPNPVTDKLMIEMDSTETSEYLVEIVDITGKILLSENIHSSKTELNVSQLQQGIYIVYLKNESEMLRAYRFIKN